MLLNPIFCCILDCFSIISSLTSFQEQWASVSSGFSQEATQSINAGGTCMQGLGSLVMDIQARDISHHGGATIPSPGGHCEEVLSWEPRKPQVLTQWRSQNLGRDEIATLYEAMRVNWNNILKISKRNCFQSRMFRLSKTISELRR